MACENSQSGGLFPRVTRSTMISTSPVPLLIGPTTSWSCFNGLARDPSGRSLSWFSRALRRASSTTNSWWLRVVADASVVFRLSRYWRAMSSSPRLAALRNPRTVPRGVSRPSASFGAGAASGAAGGVCAGGICARTPAVHNTTTRQAPIRLARRSSLRIAGRLQRNACPPDRPIASGFSCNVSHGHDMPGGIRHTGADPSDQCRQDERSARPGQALSRDDDHPPSAIVTATKTTPSTTMLRPVRQGWYPV